MDDSVGHGLEPIVGVASIVTQLRWSAETGQLARMPGGRSAGCREYSNAGSTAMAARPAVRVSPAAWLISSLLGTIEPHDRVFLARVLGDDVISNIPRHVIDAVYIHTGASALAEALKNFTCRLACARQERGD